MNPDPLRIALREIADTKRLLESLITASESFDYFRAKAVLQELRLKVRTLGRFETELSTQQPVDPERIIRFPLQTGGQRPFST
ncbi:MAG: hypothetical protein AB9869_19190 [Verrucomicrobiia bacterium]